MIFSSPLFLWALTLVTIPIAIHLFQFKRYKKIYFSDISLLKEVKSQSQTKNQLRHLLILVSRIAFIVLIVLAFAEPIIPSSSGKKDEIELVSIYIDNSFSMQAETDKGSLIQEASRLAYEIATSYPKGIRFQLVTNDFTSAQKRLNDLEDFTTDLDNLTESSLHKRLNEVLNFIDQSSDVESGKRQIYLLSDFKNTLDSIVEPIDSTEQINVVQLNSRLMENIGIDSVWTNAPITQKGREFELNCRIHNYGEEPVIEVPIKLHIENEIPTSAFISIPANSYIDTSFTLIMSSSGYVSGDFSLDDFPIDFDNTYYFSLNVLDQIRVVEISGNKVKASPFKNLFADESFNFQSFNEGAIIQDSIEQSNLLILNELDGFSSGLKALCINQLDAGKNILIIPSKETDANTFKELEDAFGFSITKWDTTSMEVNALNTKHRVFFDVFDNQPENINLPRSSGHFVLPSQSYDEMIAQFFNSDPLIASNYISNGEVFFFSSPLSDQYTNLHRHALFVPIVFNIAASSGISKSLSYPLSTNKIETKLNDESLKMTDLNDSISFTPALTFDGILLNQQVKAAGTYLLTDKKNGVEFFSFNYDRKESSMKLTESQAIVDYFNKRGVEPRIAAKDETTIHEAYASADIANELWPFFVLAALILILVETVLLKIFN